MHVELAANVARNLRRSDVLSAIGLRSAIHRWKRGKCHGQSSSTLSLYRKSSWRDLYICMRLKTDVAFDWSWAPL